MLTIHTSKQQNLITLIEKKEDIELCRSDI